MSAICQVESKTPGFMPRSKASIKLYVLAALTFLIAVGSLGIGSVGIHIGKIPGILFGMSSDDIPAFYENIVVHIRLPRILLALLVGGVLAVTGAVFQSLFRNPLADPALLGISGGAAFAAATMIVMSSLIAPYVPVFIKLSLIPAAAFIGALLTSVLIFRIGTINGVTFVSTMLLAGVALNAISGAMTGLVIYTTDDQQLRDITFWMMGGLGRYGWDIILPSIPLLIIALIALLRISRELNILCLGESQAKHLGVETESIKRRVIIMVSLGVGTAVSLTGIIGFIGLITPHLVRILIGPDHRVLLPGCLLLGGALMILADDLARTIIVPQELPIGLVTAFIGGPFFIYLLLKKRGKLVLI